MILRLAALLVSSSLVGSPQLGQVAKPGKATAPLRLSKAEAWAEAVTDFVADPNVGGFFPPTDVAKRFQSLVPAKALVSDGTIGVGRNPENGIVSLKYSLQHVGWAPKGTTRIGWVNIYMPRTDPDGVDVISQVAALLKRKLPKPWHHYVLVDRYPSIGKSYYWEQWKTVTTVDVVVAPGVPEYDRTPDEGRWVVVNFSRPQSIGESD